MYVRMYFVCLSVHVFCLYILQYAIVYKSRSNSGVIKKNVIIWIAETVNKGTTYNHKVNLDSPDLVILVEIIKVSI